MTDVEKTVITDSKATIIFILFSTIYNKTYHQSVRSFKRSKNGIKR